MRDAPLAVFFYGGHWTRGSRTDYRFVGEALASAGIVAAVADYRLSPEVQWTGILEDCAARALVVQTTRNAWAVHGAEST